jgi:hypothetical protein
MNICSSNKFFRLVSARHEGERGEGKGMGGDGKQGRGGMEGGKLAPKYKKINSPMLKHVTSALDGNFSNVKMKLLNKIFKAEAIFWLIKCIRNFMVWLRSFEPTREADSPSRP